MYKQQSPQQQQHHQFRGKHHFSKRKLTEDQPSTSRNQNEKQSNLGVIGRGLATTKHFYSQNITLANNNTNNQNSSKNISDDPFSEYYYPQSSNPNEYHYFYPQFGDNNLKYSMPTKKIILNNLPNDTNENSKRSPKKYSKKRSYYNSNKKYEQTEPRSVINSNSSQLVVKIENPDTNRLSGRKDQQIKSSNEIRLSSIEANFDDLSSLLHKSGEPTKKFNLYENFLKSANNSKPSRNSQMEEVDVIMSKLSLNRSNRTYTNRNNNANSNSNQRSKKQTRNDDGFEFNNSNEFWEDDDFLLTIGQNYNSLNRD